MGIIAKKKQLNCHALFVYPKYSERLICNFLTLTWPQVPSAGLNNANRARSL